jgi:hypothetical protein
MAGVGGTAEESRQDRRAINVLVPSVRDGTWRSLRDSRLRRSGPLTRVDTSLCKRGVGVAAVIGSSC